MDDAAFLQQCGIEVDVLWLGECICEEGPEEHSNYLKDLIRIGNILANIPNP
jgi:hypothetical protein